MEQEARAACSPPRPGCCRPRLPARFPPRPLMSRAWLQPRGLFTGREEVGSFPSPRTVVTGSSGSGDEGLQTWAREEEREERERPRPQVLAGPWPSLAARAHSLARSRGAPCLCFSAGLETAVGPNPTQGPPPLTAEPTLSKPGTGDTPTPSAEPPGPAQLPPPNLHVGDIPDSGCGVMSPQVGHTPCCSWQGTGGACVLLGHSR